MQRQGRTMSTFRQEGLVLSDFMKRSLRAQLKEQITAARRQLREQEKRLARLKFEWNIAKRMGGQARSEDEREQWRAQSDAYLGLVLKQEDIIKEIQQDINRHKSQLDDLKADSADLSEE
jgi:hypothetical protein